MVNGINVIMDQRVLVSAKQKLIRAGVIQFTSPFNASNSVHDISPRIFSWRFTHEQKIFIPCYRYKSNWRKYKAAA